MKKENYPLGILQYIPIFYVIWSDDLLSTSEINVVEKAIKEDSSIDADQKKVLKSWLKVDNPPLSSEFKKWRQLISASKVRLIESEIYPLATFSQKVVCTYHEICPFNEHLKEIEINLGIQPNHYNHLFDVEVVHEPSSDYYNVSELDTLLKGKHANVVDNFRAVLKNPIFDWGIHRNKESFRDLVLKQIQFLAREGYGAMAYPEAYGGTSDMEGYATIFENMMYVDGSLTIKFGVQFGLFGGSIQKLGTKKHHDAFLSKAGTAELLGCFAMTETGHGSNVRGIKTTATYDRITEQIIIHTPGKSDNKEYIGNALHAKMASVFAQLIVNGKNEGVHAILVPIRDDKHEVISGVTVEDNGYKLGLNGVDNGKIWFNQVSVPRENLLNKYGDISSEGEYHSAIKNPNK
ncbi:MAG: acyl-CoA dehydrogenase family protein, partial [Maribacter sp.]